MTPTEPSRRLDAGQRSAGPSPAPTSLPERYPLFVAGPTVEPIAPRIAQRADEPGGRSYVPVSLLIQAIAGTVGDLAAPAESAVPKAQVPAVDSAAAGAAARATEQLPTGKSAPAAETGAAADGAAPAAKAQRAEAGKKPTQVTAEGDNRLSLHLVDSNLREVLQLLSRGSGIAILPSDSVQGTISASLPNVDFDTALGAILRTKGLTSRREGNVIFVGTAEEFNKRDVTSGKVGTRIYRPNYVRAAELQKLITPLLTPQIGSVTVTSPAQTGIPSDSTAAGGNEYANSDVLLVRDHETVLAQIDQVFRQVDTRPMQVAIEAMILSVKLGDSMETGVDFELLRNKANIRVVSGVPLTSLDDLTAKDGLKIGFLDSSLSLFLKALESIGDTNIIATPRLLVLNKMRAEILIGSQLGYVSTTVTQTSTTQAVQFLEIGTQLRIRPFISDDGMIRMEVHPELSTGNVKVQDGLTLPNKDVTGVTTNIMARDGSTVIIGGLIREELSTTGTQIPLLGSLPAVGALFRQKIENTNRHEIIVLITPRIVCDPDLSRQGNQSAVEFHHRQAVYAEKMSPFGKRSLGKRYVYLAQQAWAAGNRERAMKHVNLAIHFDPLSRAALDLRSDIVAGIPVGDHTGQSPFLPPPEQHPLDGREIAPWILNDLDPAAPPREAPTPRPAGEPGRQVEITPSGGS